LTAGLLNFALALGVWAVVRSGVEPPLVADPAPPTSSPYPDAPRRWFMVAAFLTGTASFMYEIGWIRMLSLVLGSSTHSFELMLSAFLLGMSFGGLYIRKRIARIAKPESYLGGVMLAMGTLAVLTVPACNVMFDLMAWSLLTFNRTHSGYVAFNTVSQLIAILMMFPVTFLAGTTLPLLTHALMNHGAGEKAIGRVYSCNTIGAIVGVLLAVHVFMPLIGIKGIVLGGAGIQIALGLSRITVRSLRMPAATIAVGLSIGLFALIAVFAKLDPLRVASSVYRTGIASLSADSSVPFLRDGKTATVTVAESHGTVWIATNGKADGGVQMGPGEASADEVTVTLAAAIPLSMHPDPARVANIGFGSGLTTHMLLTSGQVKQLDSIEIEPMMVEGARYGFWPRIHDVFEDPRSHIVYEDAKTFFAIKRKPYDLIVSEPSNPWVSGVATLFSDEFYGHIVQYLRPGGYFVQWIQIYETDIGIVASVIKALSGHFGAYAIYNLDDSDILIVATRAATLASPSERIFQWPEMRSSLGRIGVRSTADLQHRLIGDGRILDPLVRTIPVPPNSDFFPFVDLNAPRLRFMRRDALELTRLALAPVPVLSLLGVDGQRGPTAEPSPHSKLARDNQVRLALAIYRALSSGRFADLDIPTASSLLILGVSAERCGDADAQQAWRNAVWRISALTTPYLNATELAEVWTRIKATPCYLRASADRRTWPDLLAVVAVRDAPEIARLGTRLLDEPGALSKDELAYITTAVAAAHIRLGQLPEARSLLQAQWNKVEHTGEYALPLRELLALSQTGVTATVAQAGH
jgi:predicted membrane-bound spermidine synthase